MGKRIPRVYRNMSYEEFQNSIANQELFSVDQTCRMIGVGKTTLYKLDKEGILKFRKVFRRTMIQKSEILKFISQLD